MADPPDLNPTPDPHIAEELNRSAYEPLLPAEKQLIAWSIALGLALLAILVWASYALFPAP